MKNTFKLLTFSVLIMFNFSFAHAGVNRKYDLCNGSIPSGDFSNTKKTFTVKATSDGNIYNGSDGYIVIHLNGTPDDILFDSTFQESQGLRIYTGRERFSSNSFAELVIDSTQGSPKSEIRITNSGSKRTYSLSCLIDVIEYPSPRNPHECNHQHCH
ncbi:MAG: hypothetical protein K2Q18_18820 [Bdellovibrionales bacterium]|nr:hypothetical protein [Bdellovibrionales bacterium]